jgi:hypothetical protein
MFVQGERFDAQVYRLGGIMASSKYRNSKSETTPNSRTALNDGTPTTSSSTRDAS